MAVTVAEVMNREIFQVHETDRADDTLATLLAMRLSAAPVVDERGSPIAMISWRDLVAPGAETVGPRATRPAKVLHPDDRLDAAAAVLANGLVHHAPVVGANGAIVGFVSALDLLAGLVGVPAAHPPLFPHFDERTGVIWTDEHVLAESQIDAAPDGAGVIIYSEGGAGRREQLLFAETTHSIRTRLLNRLSEPNELKSLQRALDEGHLRFRAAHIEDEARRNEVLRIVLDATRHRNPFAGSVALSR